MLAYAVLNLFILKDPLHCHSMFVTISVSLFVDPGKFGTVMCTCSSKSFSSFASCPFMKMQGEKG